jgi:hypothetical protein
LALAPAAPRWPPPPPMAGSFLLASRWHLRSLELVLSD